MLLIAIPLVSAGSLDGVQLAVLAMLVLASFEAAGPLAQAGQQFESCLAAARRLFELVQAEPAVRGPAFGTARAFQRGTAYSRADLPLRARSGARSKGLELDLPPGKRVAVVGESGAGKTTLINLLLRFWEFEGGTIELDGQDIRCYTAEDARRVTGVISQSAYLFTTTVRQNLRLANQEASDEDLQRVLQQAELENWINGLPDGLETWIGERGQGMSGGERQRLAAARVLLQNSPLVLLDEPTAHLDAVTAAQLDEHIGNGI